MEQALRFGDAIADLRNDYFEDPVFGHAAMRRLRERVKIPLATNTVVVDFEQLASNVLQPAVDVILLDSTFWCGIRACVMAAQVCETFGFGVAVHSSGELGIELATMLHLGAVIPNLTYRADAHYHHLVDDVIVGESYATSTEPYRFPPDRSSALRSTARNWRSMPTYTAAWAATTTIAIPHGRVGIRMFPTSISPTRTTAAFRVSRRAEARRDVRVAAHPAASASRSAASRLTLFEQQMRSRACKPWILLTASGQFIKTWRHA
jgi:hypothetical protein